MSKNKPTQKDHNKKTSEKNDDSKKLKSKSNKNAETQKTDNQPIDKIKKALTLEKSFNFIIPQAILSRSRAVCDECGFLPVKDINKGWTTPDIAEQRQGGHKIKDHIVDIENEYNGNFLQANFAFSRSRAYCDVCGVLPMGDPNNGWCTLKEAEDRQAAHHIASHIVDIETEHSI